MSTDLLILSTGANPLLYSRQTIRYLQNHPERHTFSFSIAGRSIEKLESLVAEFSLLGDAGVLIVDVVLNTVGPYWLYSSPVVAACTRNGVHHVDVNGETHWIKYHETATKTGSIIIPSCGLESVSSDIVTFLGHKTTLRSRDPQQLVGVPVDHPKALYTLRIPHTKELSARGGSWNEIRLPMLATDHFKYEEFHPTPNRAKALFMSLFVVFSGTILPIIIYSPNVQFVHLLRQLYPDLAKDRKTNIHKGFIDIVNIISSDDGTRHAKMTFKAKSDGYALSATMLSECALSLLHPETLPEMARHGGVLTPATACGEAIVKRLNATGTFEVESHLLKEHREEIRKTI
ncbi:hypothetical protein CPB85DRAFT_1454793 [Mucidula mucida]|nr:hypothetical protein CPB85DRAFT_1454793 [Mucidula mucida]